MEAEALHDFQPTCDEELGFRRGDIINIIEMENDVNWYTAELNGHIGVVPCNYISMKPFNWYVPSCPRSEAETRLMEIISAGGGGGSYLQPEGAFIIRRSEISPGGFSISVKRRDDVIHYKVLQDDQKLYSLYQNKKFKSLNQLIEYYKFNNLSPGSGNLQLIDRLPSKKYDSQHLIKRVIAQFDFDPKEDDELRFKRADIINVIGIEDDNWWVGELDGRQGLFPANYVCTLPPVPAPPQRQDK